MEQFSIYTKKILQIKALFCNQQVTLTNCFVFSFKNKRLRLRFLFYRIALRFNKKSYFYSTVRNHAAISTLKRGPRSSVHLENYGERNQNKHRLHSGATGLRCGAPCVSIEQRLRWGPCRAPSEGPALRAGGHSLCRVSPHRRYFTALTRRR